MTLPNDCYITMTPFKGRKGNGYKKALCYVREGGAAAPTPKPAPVKDVSA